MTTSGDAAKDRKEFTDIDTALAKEISKIKTTGQVEALFNSGKMNTELNKQVTALKAYVAYKNTAPSP